MELNLDTLKSIKAIRAEGKYSLYDPERNHKDTIYFATDQKKIYLNGEEYGGASSNEGGNSAGMSTNDFTDELRDKLIDIPSGTYTNHTDWASIPDDKTLVSGTITADTTLQINNQRTHPIREIHCIIKNNTSSDKTIDLSGYVNSNVESLVIPPDNIAEVNFLNDGSNYYVRVSLLK